MRNYCFLMDHKLQDSVVFSPMQLCMWSCCRWVALRPWPARGLVTCCGMTRQRTAPWTPTLQIVSASTEICGLNC